MSERFDYGAAVRVIRNVRNDGTFPGVKVGELLVRRGSVGYVRDVGTFLQDQVIYSVHFLEANRLVGCRAEELIPAEAPWVASRFETREKVRARLALAMGGTVVVSAGMQGEILRVRRDEADGVSYHVLFGERCLQVPESALTEAEE
ncbi:MAG: nitrogen fixation protein NifZ [Thiohalomonadaceae bacterium]